MLNQTHRRWPDRIVDYPGRGDEPFRQLNYVEAQLDGHLVWVSVSAETFDICADAFWEAIEPRRELRGWVATELPDSNERPHFEVILRYPTPLRAGVGVVPDAEWTEAPPDCFPDAFLCRLGPDYESPAGREPEIFWVRGKTGEREVTVEVTRQVAETIADPRWRSEGMRFYGRIGGRIVTLHYPPGATPGDAPEVEPVQG